MAAKIPVETTSAYFVGEELKGSGTIYTLPLVLIDCEGVDVSALTASSISFNKIITDETSGTDKLEPDGNISVNSIAKTQDSTRVNLTLNIPGATDVNSAAEAINGKVVKIGDFEFSANIASAYFYPKFEYVSESGGNLEFTLELTAHAGTFADGIAATDIELEGGFAEAFDKTLSTVNENTAELKFKIPTPAGQTVEDFDIDGEVTIAAGKLINAWGAATSENATYARSYSQESIGKDSPFRPTGPTGTLNAVDIDKIKQIVGGFGTGKLNFFISVALNGLDIASGILTIVDFFLPSKEDVMLELLQNIAETLNTMKDLLNKQMSLLRDTKRDIYKSDLASFDTQISTLGTLNKIVSDFLSTAAAEELGGVKLPAGFIEGLPKLADGTYDYDKVTAEQGETLRTYSTQLVAAITAAERADNPRYKGFADMFRQLESLYRTICAQVTKADEQNPMAVFDKLCSLTYNFSTSAYGIRNVQRLTIAKTLGDAMRNIVMYYGCDAENAISKSALESYKKFSALINEDTSKGQKVGMFVVPKVEVDDGSGYNKTAMCYTLGMRIVLTERYAIKMVESDNWWYHYADSDGWFYLRAREGNAIGDYAIYCYERTPTNSSEPYAAWNKRNFTDDEIYEFVERMDGRTLREELELAGF